VGCRDGCEVGITTSLDVTTEITSRMEFVNDSEMNKFPDASMAKPVAEFIDALVAGPPSPPVPGAKMTA
jgi:hypothetical protein